MGGDEGSGERQGERRDRKEVGGVKYHGKGEIWKSRGGGWKGRVG